MTEDEIFIDFQQGKIDSLYHTLYGRLMSYASRCLGEDASFMSEDCVQDAIYKTYRMRSTFQNAAAFKSYLYTCIHNHAVSILRKQMAQENYLASREEEDLQHSLLEQEVLDLLFDAIRSLPEKYRRLFDMSFEQGLKNAEIAALLHVSESAVKKQKASMIQQLRDDLLRKTGKDYMSLFLLCLM
ncbi:RNA polymerase sigma factor [Bacteroides sp. Marseille-P3684]|uniref:RNA polymerase sigma factor n=1 Tax=Bacteroides sp. Marseille-P3684 TaxID=2086579 RepID=UPI000D0EE72B|nr:sigma-70 family RNA polymerase sigma factor [Bacteroides sp. Marseille-P3684]